MPAKGAAKVQKKIEN